MRIAGKGLVDRSKPVRFRFDGQWITGFEGDTVASALLGAGHRLMGRSFKYHRPRGVMTAGSDEPNALVVTGQGAEQRPNTRATMQEIWEGLEVRSQNAWPSLRRDALAVNDLAWRFLGAGFYYKTFMWPAPFWERVYEPIIRRAAGLGALSGQSVEDRSEKAFAHCDVLVIGSGPTGLMAARGAAEAGLDVILADESDRLGGRLLSESAEIDGQGSVEWVTGWATALASMPNVRIMRRTTVTGAYDQGTYGALERVALHRPEGEAPPECFWRIHARRAVLASGALERGIAFPGNDRPGIMLAGAVRSYLNRWGVCAGQRVVVFGNNDDALRTAADLHAAGVDVAGVVDCRADAPRTGDWPHFPGGEVIGTRGRLGLSSVIVRQGDRVTTIPAECLAVSGGWNPAVHLTCHMNHRPVWRDDISAFVPAPDTVPGLVPAGAVVGKFSTAECLADGCRASAEIVRDLGETPAAIDIPDAEAAPYTIDPKWEVAAPGRAWLDMQNDVTTKDVRLAAQENFRSVEHMKRYTTQGMATDQGKGSNITALAVLADATGRKIPQSGTTTYRPPYVPVPLSAMGAGARGSGFAPVRRTTTDALSRDMGAPMVEAGLWYRPSYFPRPDERTWRESCEREVAMVRNAVGIADVSTLGKIDVQGPDAGRFLDFVYTNTMSTLKPGRVKYGLMLREDGHVMDDGTCARMSDAHYMITTTTAAATQVMSHLEFVRQAFCADLDVAVTSVTENWAQFAIAGPKSPELLKGLLGSPVRNEDWPFMFYGPVEVSGIAARLFRISFSGETGFELAVPARYGTALFSRLLERADALGGGPYGMEALNVLRIEKGFLTHAELHGRTTAFDLGLSGMLAKSKDFIGKTAAKRPGLLAEDRERLVGLRSIDVGARLTAGAHLFRLGDKPIREHDQGYVTSACYSPTLGAHISLGFLKNGPERHGESVRMVDHLNGLDVTVEVTPPTFFDPEGGRMRG